MICTPLPRQVLPRCGQACPLTDVGRSLWRRLPSPLVVAVHCALPRRRWFVFHLSVLDPMSSCNCLSVCLEEIREWSDAHPAHHILFIEIELKLTGDFLRVRI